MCLRASELQSEDLMSRGSPIKMQGYYVSQFFKKKYHHFRCYTEITSDLDHIKPDLKVEDLNRREVVKTLTEGFR